MEHAATVPPTGPPPDIAYVPDLAKYEARTARRLRTETLPRSLPDGWPAELGGKLVWEGQTVAGEYDWVYELSSDELVEVDAALKAFTSLGLSLGHITSETFPLSTLSPQLRLLAQELHLGHGFVVLRGLPVDDYTREENIILFAGLAAHVAPQRGRQDIKFEGKPASVVLTHIKDLTTDQKGIIGSAAYTKDKQVFHNDYGDVIALYCLETAAEGGASRLVSSARVYNELAKTRPDLIHTLVEDWPVEVFDQPSGAFTSRPLVFHQPATSTTPERVALQFARRMFVGFGALECSPLIPPLSEAQAEALDALHFLGERFGVATTFRKGDIQFVNNLAVFHARDAFTNAPGKERHLLRLWLRDPELAWPTPEPLQEKWTQLYSNVAPETQLFPPVPYVRSESNKQR